MNIRYEVATWVKGEPRLSYKSGLNWKTWGRRRAYDLALHLIREYEDQGVTDYEIAVYSRGGGLVWAWNACQAREAHAKGEPYIGIQPADLVHPVDMVHRMGVDGYGTLHEKIREWLQGRRERRQFERERSLGFGLGQHHHQLLIDGVLKADQIREIVAIMLQRPMNLSGFVSGYETGWEAQGSEHPSPITADEIVKHVFGADFEKIKQALDDGLRLSFDARGHVEYVREEPEGS